jgi:HK97 family phage major capsid protein
MADHIAYEVNALAKQMRDFHKEVKNSAYGKEVIEKMNKDIDKLCDVNQKIIAKNKALEQQMTDMEKIMARPGAFANEQKDHRGFGPETKAFLKFCQDGAKALSPDERKYLRTDENTQGGYLAPPEFVAEILKKITEMTPIRQYARVRQTMRDSIEIPTRTNLVNAYWIGEGGSFTSSQSTYGMEVIKVNKMGVFTIASTEMLADSAFDMDMEIRSDAVEAMSFLEGQTFVLGTGVNQPQGILQDTDIVTIGNGGLLTDINFNSLITMRGSLKTGYNGAYFANRLTIANMRLQQDGVGRYLIDFFTQTGVPPKLFGDPLVEAPALPNVVDGAFPVIYGDLSKGYNIVDGVQLAVIRDSFTLADQGKIRFIWNRRVGGQVVLPEAILKLEIV